MNTRILTPLAVATAAAALAVPALAQSAGTWMLRGGITQIAPDVSSGDLGAPSFPGTKVDVGRSTRLSAGVSYMLTDNVSLDLPMALPFRQDITGDGAVAGAGKIADIKSLPTTLLVQYRFFEPTAVWRPYMGAGLTYAKLYKAEGSASLSGLTGGSPGMPTTLSADSRWGTTFQIGTTVAIDDHWYVDAMVSKTLLKTRATLSTGQGIDIKLNPLAFQVGLGYKF